MKPKWHRADWTLLDSGEERDGTLSIYLKYDLRCWTFGVRFEHDPCWYDLHIEVGPIEFSFCYWRTYVAVLTE
jgi:hypothetical protein